MVGDGVGVLPDGVVGASLGAGLDGVLVGELPGVVPGVGPVALLLGWAGELADAFFPGVAPLPGDPGFAAPPGLVPPLAGWEARPVPADE